MVRIRQFSFRGIALPTDLCDDENAGGILLRSTEHAQISRLGFIVVLRSVSIQILVNLVHHGPRNTQPTAVEGFQIGP